MVLETGSPILSGPGIQLTAREQASEFAAVVSISTALRTARITLYSVNPEGAGVGVGTEFYYKEFLSRSPSRERIAGNILVAGARGTERRRGFYAKQLHRCAAD